MRKKKNVIYVEIIYNFLIIYHVKLYLKIHTITITNIFQKNGKRYSKTLR